jgi:hypothetical protein
MSVVRAEPGDKKWAVPWSCKGKESFSTHGNAEKAARSHRGRGKVVSCYRCEVCSLWHVGGRPK